MEEEPKKKKKWKAGIDMKEFSGTSWKDLEDIWPADVRVSSEAWRIVSVLHPAFMMTQQFMKSLLNGTTIYATDFYILCLIQRCEEAKSNVATEGYSPMKSMNVGGRLWCARKAKLTKLGLIENFPSYNVRLYRVTGLGKVIIKNFITNVEQAHQNIKHWTSTQPLSGAEKVNRYLSKYCFEFETLNKELDDQEKSPD